MTDSELAALLDRYCTVSKELKALESQITSVRRTADLAYRDLNKAMKEHLGRDKAFARGGFVWYIDKDWSVSWKKLPE